MQTKTLNSDTIVCEWHGKLLGNLNYLFKHANGNNNVNIEDNSFGEINKLPYIQNLA